MNASPEKVSPASPSSAFRRIPCVRRSGLALLATAVLLPLGAVPATAAVTPIGLPQGVTLFPERDFLGVEGFPESPLTINVLRDGIKVGTAHGTPLPNAETGTLLEVNHPGGVCWTGVTPDLLPGDRVEVLEQDTGAAATDVGQFTVTQNVTAEPAVASDLDGDNVKDDIVIHGTATDLVTGGRLAESLVEQRIVAPDLKATSVGRRDIRALFTGGIADGVATTGDIAWDSTEVTDTHWTATYTDLGANIVDIAVAGGTRVMAWERTDAAANRIGMTIYEAGELGGPGFGGCPPAAVDAVTGTVPANVTIAAAAAGGGLVVNGTSYGAASVDVTLADADADTTDLLRVTTVPTNPASTDVTVPLPKAQTWRASIPMADVASAGIEPGELTVSGVFQRVVETQTLQDTDGDPGTAPVLAPFREAKPIGGADHILLKDLVAPLAPTASPVGGTYVGTQSVDVSAADQAEETVRYRIGDATVPAPTPASAAVTGPLVVTSSQTVKAVSYDRAGNPSPLLTSAYTITTAGLPAAPAAPGTTAGNTTATLSWSAPADNGSAIAGYVVRGYTAASTLPVVELSVGNVLSTTVTGLINGEVYSFAVSAVNGIGEGPTSPRADVTPVAPRTAPFAPTVGTATALSGAANLTWTPPSSTGGSPITGYRVTAFNSATGAQVGAVRTAAATATSLQITTLANGTPYDFEVRAVNALGTGEPSGRSNTVVPAGLSGAPTGQAATAGNASAVVSWNPPANDGGASINSYRVQVRTGLTVRRTVEVFDIEAEITGLTNGTAYNFRIQAVTTAGAGALSAQTNAVTPTAPVVNTPPSVTAQTPATGATGVAVANNLTTTFSEAVSNVNGTTFRLTNPAGAAVAAVVSRVGTTNQWMLNPNANLAANTVYTARLTAGITDAGGAALTAQTWSFTTAAVANAAPTVTARTPAVNAAGVGRAANITATFSEPVTGVSGTTVTLRRVSTGVQVGAVVSYNATTRVATLNPGATLAASSQFTVSLTNGIVDAAGLPLAPVSWNFTTGA